MDAPQLTPRRMSTNSLMEACWSSQVSNPTLVSTTSATAAETRRVAARYAGWDLVVAVDRHEVGQGVAGCVAPHGRRYEQGQRGHALGGDADAEVHLLAVVDDAQRAPDEQVHHDDGASPARGAVPAGTG